MHSRFVTWVRAGLAMIALGSAHGLPAQEDAAARRAAIDAMYPVMLRAVEAKHYGRARNIIDQAIIWEPANPTHHYNLACIEALAGGDRLPLAIASLEKSVELGFNDVKSMQGDPDLAALRGDAKFAGLVAAVAKNASAGGGAPPASHESAPAAPAQIPAAPTLPATRTAPLGTTTDKPKAPPAAGATTAKSVKKAPAGAVPAKAPPAPAAVGSETPAPTAVQKGVPVGLYFMTRFWSFTGTLEKAAWYFAPDGSVYQNLEHGFSKEDLSAHAGPRGRAAAVGDKLEVTWADGKKTTSELERDGTSFTWDMGIFTAVKPFTRAAEIAGGYEGGESLSMGGSRAAVSKRLELRLDGTFTWHGVSFIGSTTEASRVSAGSTGGSQGKWQWKGYSLTLTDAGGKVMRGIVFPYDDEKTPLQPDRMFFGGIMYKRQP